MKRLLLCAALIAWSGMASAVVYKWVDAQGKVQYGDRPPDGVHAEVVQLLGTHRASAPDTSQSTPQRTPPPGAPTPVAAQDNLKKAVQDDVAEVRQKQCAEAQERYKKLIEGRHLYKVGENGERQYLTSEEIDSERVNAKADVDSTCAGTT